MDEYGFIDDRRHIQDEIQKKRRELAELQILADLEDSRNRELQLRNHPNNDPPYYHHGEFYPQQFIPEHDYPASSRRGEFSGRRSNQHERLSGRGRQPARESYDKPYDSDEEKPAMGPYGNPFLLYTPDKKKPAKKPKAKKSATEYTSPSQLKSSPIKEEAIQKETPIIENSGTLIIEFEGLLQGGTQDSTTENERLTNLLIQRAKDLLNDENSDLYNETEIKKEKLMISIKSDDSKEISKCEQRKSVIEKDSRQGENSERTEGINEFIEEQAKLTDILKLEPHVAVVEYGIGKDVEMTDSASPELGNTKTTVPEQISLVDKTIDEVLVDLFTNLHSKNKSVFYDLLMEKADVRGKIEYISEGLLYTQRDAASIISKLLEKLHGVHVDCNSDYYQLLNIMFEREYPLQETSIQCEMPQLTVPQKNVEVAPKENIHEQVRVLLADQLKGTESTKGDKSAVPDIFGALVTLLTVDKSVEPKDEEVHGQSNPSTQVIPLQKKENNSRNQTEPEIVASRYIAVPSVIIVCNSCTEIGHYSRDCPNTRCEACTKGAAHSKRDCYNIICLKCWESGHPGGKCPHDPDKVCCIICADLGHYTKDCPFGGCIHCKEESHISNDCPFTICFKSTCRLLNHSIRDCPNIVCERCKRLGHAAIHCFTRGCIRCKKADHKTINCERVIKACNKADHTADNYPVDKVPSVIIVCKSCEETGHYSRDCPNTKCETCIKKAAHSKSDCYARICLKCWEAGHSGAKCPYDTNKVSCIICADLGHYTKGCPFRGCSHCKEQSHISNDCPHTRCFKSTCLSLNHTIRDCPKIVCERCKRLGHIAIYCFTRGCSKCKKADHQTKYCPNTKKECSQSKTTDHSSDNCPNDKTVCGVCKERGHLPSDCPSSKPLQSQTVQIGSSGFVDDSIIQKVCCEVCSDVGHDTNDCPNRVCAQCKKKGHIPSKCPNTRCFMTACAGLVHTIRDCPNKVCGLCKQRGHGSSACPNTMCFKTIQCKNIATHTINDCPNKGLGVSNKADDKPNESALEKKVVAVCLKCKEVGHLGVDCPHDTKKVSCILCAKSDHYYKDCPVVECYYCKQRGHSSSNCPNTKCSKRIKCSNLALHTIRHCPNKVCARCLQPGHMRPDCPEVLRKNVKEEASKKKVCNTCKNTGHESKDCPLDVKLCGRCNKTGHSTIYCVAKVCYKCKKEGHLSSDCPGNVKVDNDASLVDNGKRNATQFLENKEIKKARISEEPQSLQIVNQKTATPPITQSETIPNGEPKVTSSVDHGKRQATEVLENQEIKKVKITMAPVALQKQATPLVTQPVPPSKDEPKVCFKCEDSGHSSKDCRICTKCRDAGHTVDECPNKVCRLCKQKGHFGISCFNKDVICSSCKQTGHWVSECPETVCTQCQKKGHLPTDCPNTRCFTCAGSFHSRRNCSNKGSAPSVQKASPTGSATSALGVCERCNKTGHTKTYCRTKVCYKCKKEGHSSINCPADVNVQPIPQFVRTSVGQNAALLRTPAGSAISAPATAEKLVTKPTAVNVLKPPGGKVTDAVGTQFTAAITATGITYPPPKVRSFIDKTADFVARSGPDFEAKLRQTELTNPKFNFLNTSNPFYAYYQLKNKELCGNRGQIPRASRFTDASEMPTSSAFMAPPPVIHNTGQIPRASRFTDASETPTSSAFMAPPPVIHNTAAAATPTMPQFYGTLPPLPVSFPDYSYMLNTGHYGAAIPNPTSASLNPSYSPPSFDQNAVLTPSYHYGQSAAFPPYNAGYAAPPTLPSYCAPPLFTYNQDAGQSAYSQNLGQSAYSQHSGQSAYSQNVGQSAYSQNLVQNAYSQNAGPSDKGVPVPSIATVTVPQEPQQQSRQPQQQPQEPQEQPPMSSSSESDSTDTVYVCNLPTPCSAKVLRDLCQTAGEVTYVAIMGSNTGIVKYETVSMAEEAVRVLDQTDFQGCTIIVGFFKNTDMSLLT